MIWLASSSGRQFLAYQAGVAVVADSLTALIFAAYLLRRGARSNEPRPVGLVPTATV